jgi:phytoene dehydrogenase-like protein
MEKSIIIVGAGIAGLSAGCYARMNGFKSTILEMHNIPGGLCTAWERKGYTWDISMHMLTGSCSGPLYQMWQELGVVQNRDFFYRNTMVQIESLDGKVLDFTTDRKKLEDQMLKLSPADAPLIREFLSLVFGKNLVNAASLKSQELSNLFDSLKILPVILPLMGKFFKYGKQTVQDFAGHFQDPFLRQALRFFIDSPGWPMVNFPMAGLIGFMKSAVSEAGVPLGGSQQVVYGIADLYRKLGGTIEFKSRVTEVIIEDNHAVGLKLDDGTEKRADIVIWAADGHTLIFDMLGGRYIDDKISKMYSDWIPVRPIIHVMIGVNYDLTQEPNRLILELDKPVSIAGEEHRWMYVIHHCFDPATAPAGKSAVEVWFVTDFDYWEKLSHDRPAYINEKKRIADLAIARLDKRWPGFASRVEVVDVPTPATYVRYTGNWKGSPDGWSFTTDNMNSQRPVRSLPGLGDLYTIGQWTAPFTGTVLAALTGRQVVEIICRKEKKKFVTSANIS